MVSKFQSKVEMLSRAMELIFLQFLFAERSLWEPGAIGL